jgi:hypothetical protein
VSLLSLGNGLHETIFASDSLTIRAEVWGTRPAAKSEGISKFR